MSNKMITGRHVLPLSGDDYFEAVKKEAGVDPIPEECIKPHSEEDFAAWCRYEEKIIKILSEKHDIENVRKKLRRKEKFNEFLDLIWIDYKLDLSKEKQVLDQYLTEYMMKTSSLFQYFTDEQTDIDNNASYVYRGERNPLFTLDIETVKDNLKKVEENRKKAKKNLRKRRSIIKGLRKLFS